MIWPIHPAAELFPMLDGEELSELAEDIRQHGLREPVWLWDDPERGTVLLDGRNRVRACEIAGVEVRTRVYVGDDPIAHVVSYNLRHRHLTAAQKADVGFRLLPLYEEQGRRKKAAAVAEENRRRAAVKAAEDAKAQPLLDGSESSPDGAGRPHLGREQKPKKRAPRSRDRAAQAVGTSGRSMARMKRITEQAPDLLDKIRGPEKMSLDRAERIIRDREAERKRVEKARQEAAAAGIATTVDIRHGDFREVLADLQDVDAIITDPPYPHEYLPLLGDLAAWADKVLKPDGVLAVLMGQTYLPEVYRLLDGHRPYRWTACYLTPGPSYASHKGRVHSNWKPLVVYGGGPRFADVIRAEGGDADAKNNHCWGQDYAAFHTIIERLTERGQTVVDPFMGSGTTLLAAHALGRHAIGCDIDQTSVAKARERLQ